MSHETATVLPNSSALWKIREPSAANFSVSRAQVRRSRSVKLP